MKLYVGGLHFSITSEQLHALFAPFGEIDKVTASPAQYTCPTLPYPTRTCPNLPRTYLTPNQVDLPYP